jgi:hypothetical protein
MQNRRTSFKAAAAVVTAAVSLLVPAMNHAPGRPDKEFGDAAKRGITMDGGTQAPLIAPVQPATISLAVNLIWEGRELAEHDLAALRQFRSEFGSVPMTHFVSPAYFVKPGGADGASIKSRLGTVIREEEHVGLYLSGWKSLTERAGVTFRNGPTFWGPALGARDCTMDCGLDVPVHVYSDDDLVRLVDSGRQLLAAHGYPAPVAMATAGWVASPAVLDAATKNGIRYDFSAVAPEVVVGRLGNFPIYDWIKGLWPQTTPHSQPYVHPTRSAGVTEYPQSLGAIDYITVKDVATVFGEYVSGIKHGDGDSHRVLPLTVYQESAATTLPILKKALQEIFAASQNAGVQLDWLELTKPSVSNPSQPLAH